MLRSLAPREREVFEFVVRGKMNKQIAHTLGITERTVRRDWVKARGLLYQALGAECARDLDHSGTLPLSS